jgi:hypothetical protein
MSSSMFRSGLQKCYGWVNKFYLLPILIVCNSQSYDGALRFATDAWTPPEWRETWGRYHPAGMWMDCALCGRILILLWSWFWQWLASTVLVVWLPGVEWTQQLVRGVCQFEGVEVGKVHWGLERTEVGCRCSEIFGVVWSGWWWCQHSQPIESCIWYRGVWDSFRLASL